MRQRRPLAVEFVGHMDRSGLLSSRRASLTSQPYETALTAFAKMGRPAPAAAGAIRPFQAGY